MRWQKGTSEGRSLIDRLRSLFQTASMLSPRPLDSKDRHVIIRLQEHELAPLVEGALWWPARKTLIVSDLHLEKGISFARGGQYLPPYDSWVTLAHVKRLIDQMGAETVISLGDSFHTPDAADRLDDALVTAIREVTTRTDWIWVEGNHDPDPPRHLGGRAAKELCVGRLVFRHEPTGEAGEVAGHLHPCARIAGRGGKVLRRRCFVTNGDALILPAMGAFAGGLNVLDPAYQPVLGPHRQALMMGEGRVYAVPTARLVPDRTSGRVWTF